MNKSNQKKGSTLLLFSALNLKEMAPRKNPQPTLLKGLRNDAKSSETFAITILDLMIVLCVFDKFFVFGLVS